MFSTVAKAEIYSVSSPTDFVFNIEQTQNFSVRTYASQNGIDSMLWLYDSNDLLITANDDYYGLDSYIGLNLQPGTYRLRMGVCCGNPNAWYGSSYTFDVNINGFLDGAITTTTVATTTIPPTTTTTIPLPENSLWGMANEGSDLSLTAPDGYIFSDVFFASYGTPNGSSGSWSISQCHAENSLSIARSYVIGNTSFSIPANNSIFGDPCGGSYKRLVVTVLYEPVPVTTTTSTTSTTTTTTTSTSTTTTTTTVPETTTIPTTTTIPATTTTQFITPIVISTTSTTTTVPQMATTTSTSTSTTTTTTTTIPKEDVNDLVENIENLNKTEIVNLVKDILTSGIDKEEAVAIATSPEVLNAISNEEAKQIFQEISVEELSPEQEAQLVEAITNAPDEVKEAFEQEIDIFGEGLDDYVPTGSSIDVKARRALIAVTTAITTITTAPTPSGSNSGGGSPDSGGSGDSGRRRRSGR